MHLLRLARVVARATARSFRRLSPVFHVVLVCAGGLLATFQSTGRAADPIAVLGGTGAEDPDSGLGGTGAEDPDSGLGGTSIAATDSGLGGCDGDHENGEDVSCQILEPIGEGDQVQVDIITHLPQLVLKQLEGASEHRLFTDEDWV